MCGQLKIIQVRGLKEYFLILSRLFRLLPPVLSKNLVFYVTLICLWHFPFQALSPLVKTLTSSPSKPFCTATLFGLLRISIYIRLTNSTEKTKSFSQFLQLNGLFVLIWTNVDAKPARAFKPAKKFNSSNKPGNSYIR